MRVILIGSVTSTAITLRKLIEHNFEVVGVLGYEPADPEKVSGYYPLRNESEKVKVEFRGYDNINLDKHFHWAKQKEPQLIFAVGFSQLLEKRWLELPRLGCIGFHPTPLPQGRGRAPIAWTILDRLQGAVNFFLIGSGADDGPIFIQKLFDLGLEDDAESLRFLILENIGLALDEWLPQLVQGIWSPVEQNHEDATYYGRRFPADSCISFSSQTAAEINRIVKASTRPHSGAMTFHKNKKVIIWKTHLEEKLKIKGVPGRILLLKDGKVLVQCKQGLIWLDKADWPFEIPSVGARLGYNMEYEIFKIWNKINE